MCAVLPQYIEHEQNGKHRKKHLQVLDKILEQELKHNSQNSKIVKFEKWLCNWKYRYLNMSQTNGNTVNGHFKNKKY